MGSFSSFVAFALITAGLVVCTYFTYESGNGWFEFILGYEYEQAYSSSIVECTEPNANTTRSSIIINGTEADTVAQCVTGTQFYVDCESLYRHPLAINDGYCKTSYFGENRNVICPVKFLKKSRVYVITGLTRKVTSISDEYSIPGFPHTNSDPKNWLLYQHRENSFVRILSSSTQCYDKSERDTNKCIFDFILAQKKLSIYYCWATFCNEQPNATSIFLEGPWYTSSWFYVTLVVLSTFSFMFCLAYGYMCIRELRSKSKRQVSQISQQTQTRNEYTPEYYAINDNMSSSPVVRSNTMRQEASKQGKSLVRKSVSDSMDLGLNVSDVENPMNYNSDKSKSLIQS